LFIYIGGIGLYVVSYYLLIIYTCGMNDDYELRHHIITHTYGYVRMKCVPILYAQDRTPDGGGKWG